VTGSSIRFHIASFKFELSILISQSPTTSNSVRLTVDCVTHHSMKTISSQHLYEAGLFSQTLYSSLILTVEKRLMWLLTHFTVWIAECAEDKLVFHIIMSLNWLTVQLRAYLKHKHHLKSDIEKQKDTVDTSKSNNIKDHTEEWVVVYKEDIDLSILKSVISEW